MIFIELCSDSNFFKINFREHGFDDIPENEKALIVLPIFDFTVLNFIIALREINLEFVPEFVY